METHYIKNQRVVGGEVWDTKLNQFESVLYNLFKSNTVVGFSDLVEKYYYYCFQHPDDTSKFTRNPKDIESNLEYLVKKGFIRKVSGKKLQRI